MRPGWTTVTLGDICEFKYGKALAASVRVPGDVPVYGSNGQVGLHDKAATDGQAIIIGRKGSFGEVNFSAVPCWPIDTTYYVDQSATEQDLGWLRHILPNLRLTELNRAAAVPGLNREDAYRRELQLPPIEEQRRIAAILDHATKALDARGRAISRLGEAVSQAFVAEFGHPLTNAKSLPLRRLGSIGTLTTGNTPPRADASNYGGQVEWIKSGDILDSQLHPVTAAERLSDSGATIGRIAPTGSVLVVCIAGSRNSIGRSALLDRHAAFNQQINAVTLSDGSPRFLLEQLRLEPEIVRAKSTGGMKGLVSKSALASVEVLWPSPAQQADFVRQLEVLDRLSAGMKESRRAMDQLLLSLQARAFSGRL
ncbi:MAG: restriction endonuclease subunit S [Austwickia sp.]|nr:MAG: restriction endonuclease subunit S [Austwickia sp.]